MAAPSLASATGTGQITGTVTDAITHNPIENIKVCAYPPLDVLHRLEQLDIAAGHAQRPAESDSDLRVSVLTAERTGG